MVLQFLGRLKQRNVFRVAGLYAVTGYAVFQICNNLLPALNLPRWTVSLVAVLFLCGFPIVMIVAYAFEKTDGGFRRTTSQRLATGDGLGWFDWTLLGAIVVIIGIAITQFAGLRVPMKPAVTAAAEAPGRSIAMLPFVNFGDTRDDDYFADGLTEELINGLAQSPIDSLLLRTQAFALMGRVDEAIAELQRAEAQGYRNLVDIDYFVRLDEYPFMAQVARDGRFKALVARIETDLERMRNLLRSRTRGEAAR